MDAHYADTYARRRYDDMLLDTNGAFWTGCLTPTWADDEATRLAASDAVIAQLDAGSLTDTECGPSPGARRVEPPGGQLRAPHRDVYADTRYEPPSPPQTHLQVLPRRLSGGGWHLCPTPRRRTATDGAGNGGEQPSDVLGGATRRASSVASRPGIRHAWRRIRCWHPAPSARARQVRQDRIATLDTASRASLWAVRWGRQWIPTA